MAPSICGNIVKSKRTLLALGWSVVNLLTFLSFLSCLLYVLLSAARTFQKQQQQLQQGYYYYPDNNDNRDNLRLPFITSRAMAFTALWIMALSAILGMYGTMVLGFVSPLTARYYWCCAHTVHKTTPMILGAFIGSLLMYANLTLVCSVLFGEFQVRDWGDNGEGEGRQGEGEGGGERDRQRAIKRENMSKSSTAFSILCIFLTILYAGFAALVFVYSDALMEENRQDLRREALRPSSDDLEDYDDDNDRPNREMRDGRRGLIGNRFTVPSPGSAVGVSDAFIRSTDSGSFGAML